MSTDPKYLKNLSKVKRDCYTAMMHGLPWTLDRFERECFAHQVSPAFHWPQIEAGFARHEKHGETYITVRFGALEDIRPALTPEKIAAHAEAVLKFNLPKAGERKMSALERLHLANNF